MATITAKVGPKYQLVIPKKLRAAAKLKVGDFLKAELRGDGILLTPPGPARARLGGGRGRCQGGSGIGAI